MKIVWRNCKKKDILKNSTKKYYKKISLKNITRNIIKNLIINLIRNITIGSTDGITVPFALAAGLSNVINSSFNIAVACIALSIAGGITMGAGAYLEQKKSGESVNPLSSALIIGISYITGGFIASVSYLFVEPPINALFYSAICSLIFLFIAGYYESRVNDVNGWIGGTRVMVTGAVAALAAFYVSRLFS